jgi:tellurite resistance protein TerC
VGAVDVPMSLWLVTVGALAAVIVLDLVLVDSTPGEFGPREATRWVAFYVGLAALFGIGLWVVAGGEYAAQFFAGYITEYSLSVDNLFVFMVIISSFAVPRIHQHRVLLVGVVIALILRAVLIALGAAAIERFAATFFLFGLLLLYTAAKLLTAGDGEPDLGRNPLVRLAERFLPTTRDYHGAALSAVVAGRRVLTPMALVIVAIGTTDVLFALDSIPAIFGLTQEPYLVFTANAFALMGLRQLYFLVTGLLERLVYLSIGLAAILGFIGIKLILQALHETTELPVPTISVGVSLVVILTVLVATTVASLLRVRRSPGMISATGLRLHEDSLRHSAEELERIEEGEEAPGQDPPREPRP